MDQDALVMREKIDNGKKLIDTLNANGFVVGVAFWTKSSDDGKWLLYLSSRFVEENGQAPALKHVYAILRNLNLLWIDTNDIRILPLNDNLTKAALTWTTWELNGSTSTKPYPGGTWYGGDKLVGISIENAYIYPAYQSANAA